MNVTLRVWRQAQPTATGRLVDYADAGISPDMSFLEMLDVVNEGLIKQGDDPIAFDSDCREGICGTCGLMVNGVAHGPEPGTTVCQLHMRRFKDGDTIVIEPWRAKAFPVAQGPGGRSRGARPHHPRRRLHVDQRRLGAGRQRHSGCRRRRPTQAMDYAQCIGCGACVAACKNASAALFTSAKIAHLALLPQGQPERQRRVTAMVDRMDAEGFGSCSNEGECEAVCPKEISIAGIARMNREYAKARSLGSRRSGSDPGSPGRALRPPARVFARAPRAAR